VIFVFLPSFSRAVSQAFCGCCGGCDRSCGAIFAAIGAAALGEFKRYGRLRAVDGEFKDHTDSTLKAVDVTSTLAAGLVFRGLYGWTLH